MGLIKGNPVMLVTLFFGAAVLSSGGVYALVPSLLERPTPGTIALVTALSISLCFSLLVVGRTFWIVAGAAQRKRTT